jgi:glycosyltransferase involved in cell wall biosynthesis
LNILQLNKYITVTGGSESVMDDLTRLFIQRRHTVYNMGYHKSRGTRLENSIDLGPDRFSPFHWLTHRSMVNNIIAFIVKNNIEVMICHNIYHHFPCYALLSQIKARTKAKCVLIVHDPKPICPNHMLFSHGKICEKCKKRRFYKCIAHLCKDNSLIKSSILMLDSYYNSLLRDFYAFFDSIIAPSFFLKNKLKEMGFNHPVQMIRNPFENTAAVIGDTPSIEQKTLVFVGRLSEEKGIRNILEIITNLKDIKLLVIGDGPLKNMVASYAEQNKNITYLGYKSRQDIFKYMSKSSYLILPTIWYENCPVVILEAMNLGLPVLGSNIGGIPEIVEDGRGFLFDPFNKMSITSVISKAFSIDPGLYQDISNRCRIFSRTVSFDNYYKSFSEYAFATTMKTNS